MFEGEWSAELCVAFRADGRLAGGRAQHAHLLAAVLVVAIRTLHMVLIHWMAERAVEIHSRTGMAVRAEIRLFLCEQELIHLGMMDGVTIEASDVGGHVRRAREIIMLTFELMAVEAPLRDLFGAGEDGLE